MEHGAAVAEVLVPLVYRVPVLKSYVHPSGTASDACTVAVSVRGIEAANMEHVAASMSGTMPADAHEGLSCTVAKPRTMEGQPKKRVKNRTSTLWALFVVIKDWSSQRGARRMIFRGCEQLRGARPSGHFWWAVRTSTRRER